MYIYIYICISIFVHNIYIYNYITFFNIMDLLIASLAGRWIISRIVGVFLSSSVSFFHLRLGCVPKTSTIVFLSWVQDGAPVRLLSWCTRIRIVFDTQTLFRCGETTNKHFSRGPLPAAPAAKFLRVSYGKSTCEKKKVNHQTKWAIYTRASWNDCRIYSVTQ